MHIYIGDSSKIRTRIRNQHCGGNIEGSSMRKLVARNMGYTFTQERRINGSLKVRLNMPNPSSGEKLITNYIRFGVWKYVVCPPTIDAKDFQFYVIQNIIPTPILNINHGNWQKDKGPIYQNMLQQLLNCAPHNYEETANIPDASGVYLFLHDKQPNK